MLWNENLEEFVRWFASVKTASESQLRAALTSVPDDVWATVDARLSMALTEEEGRYLTANWQDSNGVPMGKLPPDPASTMDLLDIVRRKQTLLAHERQSRQARRP